GGTRQRTQPVGGKKTDDQIEGTLPPRCLKESAAAVPTDVAWTGEMDGSLGSGHALSQKQHHLLIVAVGSRMDERDATLRAGVPAERLHVCVGRITDPSGPGIMRQHD